MTVLEKTKIRLGKVKRQAMMDSLRREKFEPLQPYDPSSGNPEMIVSLTTFGKRLATVDIAIRSIFANTVKPNRIILWLDDETSSGELPHELDALLPLGLDVRTGCANLRGHKKYYWAMLENPNSIVITIDDDVMYAQDTMSSLLASFHEHPNCVSARRVHRILPDTDGKPLPYDQWEWQWHGDNEPHMDLLATGVGGVLYPPSCIQPEGFDERAIEECAISADDIWLKVCELRVGTPVVWAKCKREHPWVIPGSQESALNSLNVFDGGNDRALEMSLSHFGISQQRLRSKLWQQ
jgi:hypothetical protein